jgi:hypothetical protein
MADQDPKDNEAEAPPVDPYEVAYGAMVPGAVAMHEQIIQQVSDLLRETNLSEEDKQRILASISCPCCGGAGPSLSFDLGPPKEGPVY